MLHRLKTLTQHFLDLVSASPTLTLYIQTQIGDCTQDGVANTQQHPKYLGVRISVV